MGEILFWMVMCPKCGSHIEEEISLDDEYNTLCGNCGEVEVPCTGVTRDHFAKFSKEKMTTLHKAAAEMLEVK